MFTARTFRRKTRAPIQPLRNTNSSANNSGNIEEQPNLSRANSHNIAQSSISSASNARGRAQGKTLREQLQSAIAPHLMDAKSPQEMARIKRQHAALIQQLQQYRNLVGGVSDIILSDAQLGEKDNLIDIIYASIEEVVINSAPRQNKKQIASVEKELTLLARDFGYEGKDENARKEAIVNSFAYMGQKFGTIHNYYMEQDATSPPKLPVGMAAIMYKGNNQISDMYRAITNKDAPLNTEVVDVVELGIRRYSRNKIENTENVLSISTCIAGGIGVGVGLDLGDFVFGEILIGILGGVASGLLSYIPGYFIASSVSNIARKNRINSDKTLRTLTDSGYAYAKISHILSEKREADIVKK
jgi:hypothetical protein